MFVGLLYTPYLPAYRPPLYLRPAFVRSTKQVSTRQQLLLRHDDEALAPLLPRARTYELVRARSRLYRSQILQVNMRLKALAEIYTMHPFAQL